jgi:hypothetical protein
MTDLVIRLRMTASAFSNHAFWAGREPDQEEAGIITDLREAADRIASLELALVELSQTNGSPSNFNSASVLAAHVRVAARRALRQQPTDDKINEAFKRATRC